MIFQVTSLRAPGVNRDLVDASALIVVWLWLYCFCFCYNVGPSTRVNKKGSVSDLDTMQCDVKEFSSIYGYIQAHSMDQIWNLSLDSHCTLYLLFLSIIMFNPRCFTIHKFPLSLSYLAVVRLTAAITTHNSIFHPGPSHHSPATSYSLSSGSDKRRSEEWSEMRGGEWLTPHQAVGISAHTQLVSNLSLPTSFILYLHSVLSGLTRSPHSSLPTLYPLSCTC